jgi:hypothetical protein
MADQGNVPQPMSEIGRLTGIFWEPRPVFEDLAAHPRFWTPLILLTLLSIVFVSTFTAVVGWDTYMEQQMERQAVSNPRIAQMSPEQRQRAMEMSASIAKYAGIGGAIFGFTLMSLLISGVLLGVMNSLGGANLRFKQAFSITCYSFLPSALSSVLALIVMLLKRPEDFDLQNPLPANLGAFLTSPPSPRWLQSAAGSIDLFSIWIILLLALGFSTASKQRLSYGKALSLVVAPWLVYVVVKSLLAGLGG